MVHVVRKRILYIMHVDWDWIKQRPHFIAQHLSRAHDVLVAYPLSKNRALLSNNSHEGLRTLPFFRLPLARRIRLVRGINRMLLRIYFWVVIKVFRPEYVWLTFPELFHYLPKRERTKIIYDCMDDAIGFHCDAERKALLLTLEEKLVAKAAHVFCSSRHLTQTLALRTSSATKCTLVRNAFEPDFVPPAATAPPFTKESGRFTLGYIGTISQWLDFDALLACVEKNENLEIHLLGPVDDIDTAPWLHDRIRIHGPVRHSDLLAWASCFDALIMPFRVTELIRSVDPVKLYEYIYFNKPIIAVRYPEIERFSDFVNFYSTPDQLSQTIKSLASTGFRPSYTQTERQAFLSTNTWSARVASINETLAGL